MAIVRDGIYLEDNPPVRDQFLVGRRDPGIRAQLIVHTAQPGTDTEGEDPKAENVARFIQRRTDAGSYHLLGDRDSILQMVRFENEAFHCRGGRNRYTIGISLAMNAEDWPSLSARARDQFLDTAAHMTVMAAQWMKTEHGLTLPARWLTRAEFEAGQTGITSHAAAEPTRGRRSDPGPDFPIAGYLTRFERLQSGGSLSAVASSGLLTPVQMVGRAVWGHSDGVATLQADLNTVGLPVPALAVDGIWGPKTEAALAMYLVDSHSGPDLPGLRITADPALESGQVVYEDGRL